MLQVCYCQVSHVICLGEPKAKSIKRKSDNSKKAKPAPKRAKEAPAGHAVMALPKTDVFLSTDDDGD